MWLDWLDFCEHGSSVSALWCPLATPTILLGFLLLWAWGICSWLLQQSVASAPYLGRGVAPYRQPSWPSTWNSSSRPSCTSAATTLLDSLYLSFFPHSAASLIASVIEIWIPYPQPDWQEMSLSPGQVNQIVRLGVFQCPHFLNTKDFLEALLFLLFMLLIHLFFY